MEVQCEGVPDYKSVVERYFTEKYYINEKKKGEDVCLLAHSNKICIVTVPDIHPIRKERKTVEKVDYKFGDVNRLSNIVIGKGKKGAQPLTAQSSLCEITCTDGCKYVMLCGMKGQLLEINDNLKSNPHLVTEKCQVSMYSEPTTAEEIRIVKVHTMADQLLPQFETNQLDSRDTLGHCMKKAQTDGYIAIVLPKLKEYGSEMKKLLSRDEYLRRIETT